MSDALGGELGGALGGACAFAGETLPTELPAEPWGIFAQWMREAAERRTQPNPNAMVLSTIDADGGVSSRVVLCRAFDARAGYLTFFTNYRSRKGEAIAHDARVALCFHWDLLDRQVRVEGIAVRAPRGESEAYFASRPVMSRVAAWASDQSSPVASRDELLAKYETWAGRFGVPADAERTAKGDIDPKLGAGLTVARPDHWGGYRVYARSVELWLGHSARLHDRARWERGLVREVCKDAEGVAYDTYAGEAWRVGRLQP